MSRRFIGMILMLLLTISLIHSRVPTVSAASHSTSEKGISFIKEIEGFTSKAYWDNGHWSIGYGTTSSAGATITVKKADKAMRKVIANLDEAVNEFADKYDLDLSQAKHDALVSFSYNCGTAWMKESGRFRTAVIKGRKGNDFLFAISLWGNVGASPEPGLLNRRICEANMYLYGKYSTKMPSTLSYTIFDTNGGVAGNNGEDEMQGYKISSAVDIRVANPTKAGAKFKGWYTSPSGGTKVTKLSSDTAGKVLYAHWSGTANEKKIASGVVKCDTYVNIRSGAGTGYTVVGKAVNGTKVDIYEYNTVAGSKWGRTATGWICMDYVISESSSETKTDTASEVTVTGTVTSKTELNVRSGAGTDKKLVGSLAPGKKVTIYEIQTVNGVRWGRIDTGKWVCMTYITEDDQQKKSDGKVTGIVTSKTGLIIRSGAGVNYNMVGSYQTGAKVSILEQKSVSGTKWGRTALGWVCMTYISTSSS